MNELKKQLTDALKKSLPEIGKEYLYQRCVNKYLDAMIPAIRKGIAKTKRTDGEFYLAQSELREQIGTIGKQQQYIYYAMRANPATSLVAITNKGFSQNGMGRLSSAILNPKYKELVIQALTTEQTTSSAVIQSDSSSNVTVLVDIESLRSYIAQTRRTLNSRQGSSAYQQKLFRNLNTAIELLGQVLPPNKNVNTHYLNERWTEADSGRIYGQGLSLQCTAKEVRHAALGICHKYDFQACAFAVMASLAHSIDPTLRLGAVIDYIKRRQKIRAQIAKQVGISESLVKTIFTAIGFGAEVHNNPYKSIRGALAEAARQEQAGNERLGITDYQQLGEAQYQTLIANQTFAFIYKEFQAINQTILEYFRDKPIEIDGHSYSDMDPKTGKRRSAKQKLAWIYQALESKAMRQFVELTRQTPLLTTHDCIYLKQKLSANQILDITVQIQEIFPYLRFEHEAIQPISTRDHFEKRFGEFNSIEQAHREHICREEMAALDWAAKRVSG